MTEKLKDLMDDAADLEFAPVDLDAVTRAGDRTVRRRRGVTGLAALATAAVVGGVAYVGLPGGEAAREQTPVVSVATGQVSYVLDGTLHTESGSWPLGHPASAYVTTDAGVAYADPQGRVHAEGGDAPIGHTDARFPRLVADGEGSLVGWVDTSGARPVFVVHDLASGTEVMRSDEFTEPGQDSLADGRDPAYFYAIDGRTAYWRDGRGAVAVDLDSGGVRVVDANARNGFDILAVEDGLIASDAGDAGTRISTDVTGGLVIPGVYGSLAVLSPDARWISVDADEPQVYDARDGSRVDIDVQGRVFATGYAWLDDGTLAVIAARSEAGPAELLRCRVPQGDCSVAFGDLGTFEELQDGSFALPVGESLAQE
jgi:hypothetical protein